MRKWEGQYRARSIRNPSFNNRRPRDRIQKIIFPFGLKHLRPRVKKMPKRSSINHHMINRTPDKDSINKLGHLNGQQRLFMPIVINSFMMIKKRLHNQRDIVRCKDIIHG
ncbi:hypothetical protein HanRHA438_Chr02g0056981 [Helianthus annuus]|nr:hypothetical protein HanRHA438_Chr02g0056981 [Helianthus annuus]